MGGSADNDNGALAVRNDVLTHRPQQQAGEATRPRDPTTSKWSLPAGSITTFAALSWETWAVTGTGGGSLSASLSVRYSMALVSSGRQSVARRDCGVRGKSYRRPRPGTDSQQFLCRDRSLVAPDAEWSRCPPAPFYAEADPRCRFGQLMQVTLHPAIDDPSADLTLVRVSLLHAAGM